MKHLGVVHIPYNSYKVLLLVSKTLIIKYANKSRADSMFNRLPSPFYRLPEKRLNSCQLSIDFARSEMHTNEIRYNNNCSTRGCLKAIASECQNGNMLN